MTRDEEILLEELVSLSPIEYERRRSKEAKNLGLNPSSLDRLVKKARKNTSKTQTLFNDIEPYPEEVNGEILFQELVDTVNKYCVLPKYADVAVALWILFTYLINAFLISPIIAITSPSKRCGKSTLLTLVKKLSYKSILASNISSAVLYRAVEKFQPTLLIDEADTFMKHNNELRGIINSGHTRDTATVLRADGNDHETKEFSTWCPKAIACIGELPETITDRSIELPLKRKLKDEVITRFSLTSDFYPLQQKCKRWADDHYERIANTEPIYLDSLNDRAADNWSILLVIADQLGVKGVAIEAANELSSGELGEDELIAMLLHDIQKSCGDSQVIPSQELTDKLVEMVDRPWPEFSRGKSLTQARLARLLKPLGVRPKNARFGEDVVRSYKLEDFNDAFTRYLGVKSATPLQSTDSNASSTNQNATNKSDVALSKSLKAAPDKGCSTVALSKGLNGLKHIFEQATEGYSISAVELYVQFDEEELQSVRDGTLTLQDLRQVAKDCQHLQDD